MSLPSSPIAIQIDHLKTQFGELVVHEDINLSVQRGEIIALIGGSGCGKSTLLREMIMLTQPAAGQIEILGQNILKLNPKQRNRLRQQLGVMFQSGALFSSLTVLENIAFPLHEHTQLSRSAIHDAAYLKMLLSGLPSHAANKYPRQLSGGMIKRAAVARALALDPVLLFLDEPTAGLDPLGANAIDELVLELRATMGLTVVIVTHDLDTLYKVPDRIVVLGERRVLAAAPLTELLTVPHPWIRDYFNGPRGRAF